MSGAVARSWMLCPPSPPSRRDWRQLPCAGEKPCMDSLNKGYLKKHADMTSNPDNCCLYFYLSVKVKPKLLFCFQGAFSGWTVMLNIDQSRESGFKRLLQSGGAKVPFCLSHKTQHYLSFIEYYCHLQFRQATNSL